MDAKTSPLQQIALSVFEMRARVIKELEVPYHQEVEEYKKAHPEPVVPFWPFGRKRMRYEQAMEKREEELENIKQKYQKLFLSRKYQINL